MTEPVAKIKQLNIANTRSGQGAALAVVFDVEHEGQTYQHLVTVESEPLTHFHGDGLTRDRIEQEIVKQANRVKQVHALAAELAPRVDVDLVSERAS